MQNYNKFDNVFLDINEEFKKQNELLALDYKKEKKKNLFLGILSLIKGVFLALLYKLGVLQKLFYANICLAWFYDFKKFWVDYLGNRNIDVIDFHFLRNTYRAKFQEVSLDHSDEKNPEKFLASWQAQGNIFYLFGSVWNYSKKAYLDCWLFAKYIKKNSYVLEYGCSIAPITQGLIKYFGYKNLKFTIADIPQITFLYARWKLIAHSTVDSIVISSAKKDNLPDNVKYNSIICLTVFEHLNNPLEVANNFLNHLEGGGILVFDYIKGEATGLDSQQSMQERGNVLKFIENNFKILKGKVDFENSMGLTIVQKNE
ncbi:MAG: methyltransferase domain-containing protein [bacterium]|nr:methyltransferase domain-containing protein [bacterium]